MTREAHPPSPTPARPIRSRFPRRLLPTSYLGRAAVLYLAAITIVGGGCLGLVRWLSHPVTTSFEADLNTTGMSFTVGDWKDTAGLFNSDQRVDVGVQEAVALRSADDPSQMCRAHAEDDDPADAGETTLALQGVRLDSLDMPPGTQVTLATQGGALHMELRRPPPPFGKAAPMATFLAGPGSRVCNLPVAPPTAETQRWLAEPGADNGLQLTLRFRKGELPEPEHTVPLDGRRIDFERGGESMLIGRHNRLVLGHDRHTLRLEHSRLEPVDMEHGTLHDLVLHQDSATDPAAITSLSVVLTGRSAKIGLVSPYTDDWANEAELYVDKLHSGVSMHTVHLVFGAAVALIGLLVAVATILASVIQVATGAHDIERNAAEQDTLVLGTEATITRHWTQRLAGRRRS